MSVKKESSGRRSVEVEVEVPGTPEEVWEAIATGPGVSSWFVPTELREDGSVISHFGPGMDAVAKQTAWDPPRRFAAEGELGPGAPMMATEWVVEACSGGTCVVRVVHSLFADTDDWDDQLENIEAGWPDYFQILRLYLTHFRGRHAATIQFVRIAPEPAEMVWGAMTEPLGLAGANVGDERRAPEGAPTLAGLVERANQPGHPYQFLLRLTEPTAGMAHLFALPAGGQVCVVLRFYLFGDEVASVAAREEAVWGGWMEERFPGDDGAA